MHESDPTDLAPDLGPDLGPDLAPNFGALLPRMVVPPPGPASQHLRARLAKVESRNVTFLGTPGGSGEDAPIFWTHARGANVIDADGNRYLDLAGAFGVAVAGHAHPHIVAALEGQARVLIHGMGDVHPPEPKVRLLEALAARAPWAETRGFLANSGSEAVEAALKTALLATGRPGILAFEGGYHGLTLGALAATARPEFRTPFARRIHAGCYFAPYPDALDAQSAKGATTAQDARIAVEQAFDTAARDGTPIGAVIIEPLQGRGGVRVPEPGFLAELAAITRAHGAVLIYDEIYSGWGRTGRCFAFEWEGVAPDLLCVGKALGGGLPLSACLGDARVMDAWPISTGEALHTSTFLGHPLACTTALAFLDVLDAEDLIARAERQGIRLKEGLESALKDVWGAGPSHGGARADEGAGEGADGGADEGAGEGAWIRGIRGRGLFLGIVGTQPGMGVRASELALQEGVIVLPAGDKGEVVELSPPLVLTDEQIDAAIEIVARAVRGAVRIRP